MTQQAPQRYRIIPWLYALGFVLLAAAIIYLWQYPGMPGESVDEVQALHAIGQHLDEVDARVSRLEQRPPPDLSKITAPADALKSNIDALDSKVAALDSKIDTMASKVADQTQVASRLDALSGRIESLSGRDQTGIDATKRQADALASRVASLEAHAANVEALDKRLSRVAKLQDAALALASGRPVGDLPDAPPALARYAHTAPPTEAQLLLRFHGAEQAALAAPQPDASNTPFLARVWDRAQDLITVRRGDDVVVGNSTATTLTQAQSALDAGDLAGAVAAVESLKGPPGQAMAGWLEDARGLLSARTALGQLAAQA
ncbi:MAG TPA: mitofilin family membrane protein [Rhodopila sp.]